MSDNPNSAGPSVDAYSSYMNFVSRAWVNQSIVKSISSRGILVVCTVGLLSGCVQIEEGFDSPAPSKRLDAIVDASALEDDQSLVKLVEKLRSQVSAERMFAIRSLEIRTGETLGYDHAAESWERLEGIGRWVNYLEEQGIDTQGLTIEDSTLESGAIAEEEGSD